MSSIKGCAIIASKIELGQFCDIETVFVTSVQYRIRQQLLLKSSQPDLRLCRNPFDDGYFASISSANSYLFRILDWRQSPGSLVMEMENLM